MKKKINDILNKLCLMLPYLFMTKSVYATSVSIAGANDALTSSLGEIISILFWIACFVCTIKIIHIGILYVLTGVEGKSKAKGALIPWLIGAFICVTFTWLGPAIMDLFYTGKGVLEY